MLQKLPRRLMAVAFAAAFVGTAVHPGSLEAAGAAPAAIVSSTDSLSNWTRLFATMANGATKGKAKYEQRGNRRKFSYEVEKAVPGTVIVVRSAGATLGSIVVNPLGRGKFELDTNLGHPVPAMAAGQTVQALVNGSVFMSGQLR